MSDNFSADDVLVGEANWLWAPLGTALPDETTVGLNDFGNWTGWTHLGYTTAPTSMSYTKEEFKVMVQQAGSPIKKKKTSETMTLGTTLAQFTGDTIALLYQGTNTDTAAGASQKAFSRVTGGGDSALPEYMVAVEGYRDDATDTPQPVRIFLYKATLSASGDVPFDRAAVAGIPITAEGLADATRPIGSQTYEIHIVTAAATS